MASCIGLLAAHGISNREDTLDDMLDTVYNR